MLFCVSGKHTRTLTAWRHRGYSPCMRVYSRPSGGNSFHRVDLTATELDCWICQHIGSWANGKHPFYVRRCDSQKYYTNIISSFPPLGHRPVNLRVKNLIVPSYKGLTSLYRTAAVVYTDIRPHVKLFNIMLVSHCNYSNNTGVFIRPWCHAKFLGK